MLLFGNNHIKFEFRPHNRYKFSSQEFKSIANKYNDKIREALDQWKIALDQEIHFSPIQHLEPGKVYFNHGRCGYVNYAALYNDAEKIGFEIMTELVNCTLFHHLDMVTSPLKCQQPIYEAMSIFLIYAYAEFKKDKIDFTNLEKASKEAISHLRHMIKGVEQVKGYTFIDVAMFSAVLKSVSHPSFVSAVRLIDRELRTRFSKCHDFEIVTNIADKPVEAEVYMVGTDTDEGVHYWAIAVKGQEKPFAWFSGKTPEAHLSLLTTHFAYKSYYSRMSSFGEEAIEKILEEMRQRLEHSADDCYDEGWFNDIGELNLTAIWEAFTNRIMPASVAWDLELEGTEVEDFFSNIVLNWPQEYESYAG